MILAYASGLLFCHIGFSLLRGPDNCVRYLGHHDVISISGVDGEEDEEDEEEDEQKERRLLHGMIRLQERVPTTTNTGSYGGRGQLCAWLGLMHQSQPPASLPLDLLHRRLPAIHRRRRCHNIAPENHTITL